VSNDSIYGLVYTFTQVHNINSSCHSFAPFGKNGLCKYSGASGTCSPIESEIKWVAHDATTFRQVDKQFPTVYFKGGNGRRRKPAHIRYTPTHEQSPHFLLIILGWLRLQLLYHVY
jgi:hypothetical protein